MKSKIHALIEACPHELCRWQPNELVQAQGEPSDSLYLVLAGELQIWIERAVRTDLIWVAGPGELAGEDGLLSPGQSPVAVRSRGNTMALRVHYADLEKHWQSEPRLARELHWQAMLGLVGRLREANCEQEAFIGNVDNVGNVGGISHGNA